MQLVLQENNGRLYERVEPMKTVRVSAVIYEMLLVVAKKRRQKPEECVEALIQQAYGAK